jgi:hypothetical protein
VGKSVRRLGARWAYSYASEFNRMVESKSSPNITGNANCHYVFIENGENLAMLFLPKYHRKMRIVTAFSLKMENGANSRKLFKTAKV